jgi:xylan 1,4-beta-xylosidase
VLALWNYADVGSSSPLRQVTLMVTHSDARSATVQLLDGEHGNAGVAYRRMGAPRYPTPAQLAQLRAAAALPAPEVRPLDHGRLDLDIPSDGLMLVTLGVPPPARPARGARP